MPQPTRHASAGEPGPPPARRGGGHLQNVAGWILGGKGVGAVRSAIWRIWFAVLNSAESYKLPVLATIFFWMFVVWVVGTNVIYFTEQTLTSPELQNKSPYYGPEHYLDAYWWVILTITSAGVDDAAKPESVAAKVEAVVIVIIGICLITVFTGNVVAILWDKLARRDLIRIKPRIAHVGQYSGHVILCNASAKFEPVLRQIIGRATPDTKIVLIDPAAHEYRTERRPLFRSTFAVTGNPDSLRVLKRADIATAAAMIVLTPDTPGLSIEERDHQALITALAAQPIGRQDNPDLRIVLEVNLQTTLDFVEIFNSLDHYPLRIEAVCAEDFQERLLSQACLTHGLSHFFDLLLTVPPRPVRRSLVGRFFDVLLMREVEEEETAGRVDTSNDVYSLPVPPQVAGRLFRDVRRILEDADGITVIGYLQWEGNRQGLGTKKPLVTLNPSRTPPSPGATAPIDYRLRSDDELFVIARPDAYTQLRKGRLPGNPECPADSDLDRAADHVTTPRPDHPAAHSEE